MSTFGEHLMLVRKRKKISQDELAKACGLHAPVIGRYERGEVKPSIEIATKMAEALQVSMDYLVGFTDLELERPLMELLTEIQKLKAEDKNLILKVVEVFLRDAEARKSYRK